MCLLVCLPLLAVADYSDNSEYPGDGMPSTGSTSTPTTPGTVTSLDQLISTDTTQGMKIFDQVNYQNMSTDKADFLQSNDNSDTPKHVKISGGNKSEGF